MVEFTSTFLQRAKSRGYISDCTNPNGLDALAKSSSITGYIGFDATADSLHVGSLVPIMLLRLLQQTGHKPIVLVGGGTTKVGDPSGKDESRKLLTEKDIQSNIDNIKGIFERFLSFGDNPTDAILVNNANWLDNLQYIPFLRDVGRHFSVNRMLGLDSVKLRLERKQPLSFLEFNYMIMQAYDFLELARNHDCRLQMGGSDQWGNIVSGIELGRRIEGKELFGLTTHLITTASGSKMGKTADGAVWLNKERLSPYEYWQFWRNTEDTDVGRFMRLFTELPDSEIAKYEKLEGEDINEAKSLLATEATALCHGRAAAMAASDSARRTFAEGGIGDDLPCISLRNEELVDGLPAFVLFTRAGLAKSNSEARRLIKNGGAKLNDEKINEELAQITTTDINQDGVIKLSAGKKRHALLLIK
ncbi:MAG: tyrosine--tRNA ligase [Rhodospirillaceae bacterium]|nr:tyrosine--tRNA ligase [Rhodospirillaceae bacterium]